MGRSASTNILTYTYSAARLGFLYLYFPFLVSFNIVAGSHRVRILDMLETYLFFSFHSRKNIVLLVLLFFGTSFLYCITHLRVVSAIDKSDGTCFLLAIFYWGRTIRFLSSISCVAILLKHITLL